MSKPLGIHRIPTASDVVPAGRCEACGRRTKESYRFDVVYLRYCSRRCRDVAVRLRAAGKEPDGTYRPRQVQHAGRSRK